MIPTLIVTTQGVIRSKLRHLRKLESTIKSFPTPLVQRDILSKKAECMAGLIGEALLEKVSWEEIDEIIENEFASPEARGLVTEALSQAKLQTRLVQYAVSLL